ncbi:zinc-binding dehydrogenase [Parageobacillus sp. VR-IP]|uniref:bi-domain-containing oxidoreductase n=1 Tax=Parageobacillus sp. VR-IP TaxID=2742205 RepID=UPI001581EC9F|nr:bi-domain-containing oxidoreductase [Parageobacillus sp. VR-IP]NUK29891.1 zinc-binding dehydrogenase [Parageobacillus sp. VR-IP]
MKQVLQNLNSGETKIEEIPTPSIRRGKLLIKTIASVVSSGTERMLVDFGRASYLQKARQQPEKVKQVIDKIKTDGLQPTINAVRTKLDQPLPLGYSNAGIVVAVGEGVEGFKVGDRVVSNGPHAEVVCVPKNLCAKIPDNVDFESAAFTVISSIGLQGIRLAQPTLGETFVVIGLGLIGLITVQLLKAHGCKVLATDFDQNKVDLAKSFGAEAINLSSGIDPVEYAQKFTNGRGVDGVIITASTKSSEPVSQAAKMCRKRGRIILVGVTGLELSRSDFYEKELTFQVSCSYGPGRYDVEYEEKGKDYPFGFVRWTEQRNFEAVLDMMAEGKLNVKPLISKVFSIDEAVEAYRTLSEDKSVIGIVLKYPEFNGEFVPNTTVMLREKVTYSPQKPIIGVIGAGNYTNQTLLPAMKKLDVQLKTIVSSGGINGVHVGKRFNFEQTTTDAQTVINDSSINTVFITTRHDTHAYYVKEAINAGKHVFVEKPLCLTHEELEELKKLNYDNKILMVGFNRRFAPHIQKMKELLDTTAQPKTMVMLVNAGYIPADHWTQDPKVGGGRIIGEACHFIDLLRFLAGSKIKSIQGIKIGDTSSEVTDDKATITITFEDGSIGTVHYFANGHKSYPKEKLEVFVGGKILSLDNFKTLYGYGWSNFKKMKLRSQDKGHLNGVKAFINGIESGYAPIPLEEIFEVTQATLDVAQQLRY